MQGTKAGGRPSTNLFSSLRRATRRAVTAPPLNARDVRSRSVASSTGALGLSVLVASVVRSHAIMRSKHPRDPVVPPQQVRLDPPGTHPKHRTSEGTWILRGSVVCIRLVLVRWRKHSLTIMEVDGMACGVFHVVHGLGVVVGLHGLLEEGYPVSEMEE